MRVIVLFYLLLLPALAFCQAPDSVSLNINARIRSSMKDQPLQSTIALEIITDSVEFTQVLPIGEEFEFGLPFQDEYKVKFSSPGFQSKIFYFNLMTPDGTDLKKGYGMNLDIKLDPSSVVTDMELYKEPIGRASWDEKEKEVVFDQAYTNERLKLIEESKTPKK